MKKSLIITISSVLIVAVIVSLFFFKNDRVNTEITQKQQISLNEIPLGSEVLLTNNNSQLNYDFDSASLKFSIGDSKVFKSVPEGEISGLNRMLTLSMVSITIINDNGETEVCHSYSECVSKGKYKVYSDSKQLKIVFDFSTHGITIPLDISFVDENSFKISIVANDIVDTYNKLVDITLLPYFGAAGIQDEGYILIPDGSGAAVEFNNGKSSYGTSKYSIYGKDAMDMKDYYVVDSNSLNLPMYALMYGGETPASLVAYVNKGEALSSLNLSVSDSNCPYNTAYFTFNYRPYTLTTILDRTSKAQKFYIASKEAIRDEIFEISYSYFSAEKANLKSVSEYVSNKIFGDRDKKESKSQNLYFDMYLSVYTQVYTAGIPHNTNVALTSLDDCHKIAEKFKDSVMLLRGLDEYGANSGNIDTKFKISRKIGDYNDYCALSEISEIYNLCEFSQFKKDKLGYSKLFDSARSVTGETILKHSYNPATLLSDETFNLISPIKIKTAVDSYMKSIDKKTNVKGLAPLSIGNSPYTDNMNLNRQDTQIVFTETFEKIKSSNCNLLLNNPDGYAFGYADKIINLPTKSSGQSLIDYDIPFIQMVVRDFVDYSSEPINISGNMHKSILDAAKTGSNLCFALTFTDYKTLKETELDYLYGTDYSKLENVISDTYSDYTNRNKGIIDSSIVDYKNISQYVFETIYENGTSVYVNYSDKDFVLEDGTLIKAQDYVVLSREGVNQ